MLLPFLSLSQLSPFSPPVLLHPLSLSHCCLLSFDLVGCDSPPPPSCLPEDDSPPLSSSHASFSFQTQIRSKESANYKEKIRIQSSRKAGGVKREREVYLSSGPPMVFPSPSVPVYLDPHPPNWNNQQQGQQPRASGGADAPLLPVGPAAATSAAPEPSGLPRSSSAAASAAAVAAHARPNSMAERARLARMPQPEPALKCPRCESTNTKFCYYNNYSLSQPRHFCKTCRRYWTRGGSLRNVPVGGGCRRNKRSSKSSGAAAGSKTSSSGRLLGGPSATPSTTPGAAGAVITPGLSSFSHHLPFLGSMHPPGPNLGLAFSAGLPLLGMHHLDTVDQFPVASGGGATIGASLEQWRVQQQQQQQRQFPFMTGGILDLPQPPTYQLGLDANRGGSGSAATAFTLGQTTTTGAATARQEGPPSKKVEDSKGQDTSLQRQYMAALRQGSGSQGVWDGNAAGGGSGNDGGGTGNGGSSWPMNIIPGFHSSSTSGGNGGGSL